jgi:imidazoleglycerol-phosphate dehydratase
MPMDETLAVAAVDLSGRPYAVVDLGTVRARQVGDLPAELVQDFFEGFASAARANVHVKVMYGRSSHHQIEAVFKAFARALRVACARDRRLVGLLPSTKGLL